MIPEETMRPTRRTLLKTAGLAAAGAGFPIRALALDALIRYRDNGSEPAPLPSDDEVLRIMEFAVAEDGMNSYLPLLEEELAHGGADPRPPGWHKRDIAADRDGSRVRLVDLRYGFEPDPLSGLWGIDTRFDDAGRIVSGPERYNSRPDVNGEAISRLFADAFPATCAATG